MHIVNTVNHGTIPNLPPEALVEVNTQVSAYGIRPNYVGPLPEPLAAHLRHFVACWPPTRLTCRSFSRRLGMRRECESRQGGASGT
jgi:hypothetical protein